MNCRQEGNAICTTHFIISVSRRRCANDEKKERELKMTSIIYADKIE